jgi:hypothetical protein
VGLSPVRGSRRRQFCLQSRSSARNKRLFVRGFANAGYSLACEARSLKLFLRVVVALAILVAALGIVFHFAVVRPAEQLARRLSQDFAEAFHFTPQIRRGDTTIFEQNTPILELTSVQREIVNLHEWTNIWMGSTKKIVVQGSFLAKAGFDLRELFTISISERPLRLRARFPAPRLLSCELQNYRIIQDESGWWNQITNDERETVFKELQVAARTKAENSDLLSAATTMLESRLAAIARKNGAVVEIDYAASAQSPSAPSIETEPLSVVPRK